MGDLTLVQNSCEQDPWLLFDLLDFREFGTELKQGPGGVGVKKDLPMSDIQ